MISISLKVWISLIFPVWIAWILLNCDIFSAKIVIFTLCTLETGFDQFTLDSVPLKTNCGGTSGPSDIGSRRETIETTPSFGTTKKLRVPANIWTVHHLRSIARHFLSLEHLCGNGYRKLQRTADYLKTSNFSKRSRTIKSPTGVFPSVALYRNGDLADKAWNCSCKSVVNRLFVNSDIKLNFYTIHVRCIMWRVVTRIWQSYQQFKSI